jgi:hypothetical protein
MPKKMFWAIPNTLSVLLVSLALLFTFSPGIIHAEDFTLVVLPDTQYYSYLHPDPFTSQTQWIIDNKDSMNIKSVIQLGDLVHHGDETSEWEHANESMGILDGEIPCFVVPGNHDYDNLCGGSGKLTTNYNTYFPHTRFQNYAWYGGNYPYGKNDNNYGFFSADGEDFLVIGLEFCPSNEALTWADNLIVENPDKKVILFTHLYMYSDNTRVDPNDSWSCDKYACCSDDNCNDGEDMWTNLVQKHSNIVLVLSGHILNDGQGRRTDNVDGHPVNQILQNYQMLDNGGDGWLRYYTFKPDENKIEAFTYSPYRQEYDTSPSNRFDLNYETYVEEESSCLDTDPNQDEGILGICVDKTDRCRDGCFDVCANDKIYDFYCKTKIVDGVSRTYCADDGLDCTSGTCEEGLCLDNDGSAGENTQLVGLAHDGNKYLAVGEHGLIGTSNNGLDWTIKRVQQGSTTMNHRAISCNNNGLCVSTGRSGQMFVTSDSFETWDYVAGAGCNMLDIDHGGGTFVAAGGYGGNNGIMYSNNNGASWVKIPLGSGREPSGVFYDGSRFIVSGYRGFVMTSSSGSSWSTVTASTTLADGSYVHQFYEITKLGNEYFAATGLKDGGGGFAVLKSENLKDWEVVLAENVGGYARGIAHDGANTIVATGAFRIFTSTNGGDTWTSTRNLGTHGISFDVMHHGNKFVTVARGYEVERKAYTSTTGSGWSSRSIPNYGSSSANCDLGLPTVNGVCHYSCGADPACHDRLPASNVMFCRYAGETHIPDRCNSSCQVNDKSSGLCESDYDCTADQPCDGYAPGTNDCDNACVYVGSDCNPDGTNGQGVCDTECNADQLCHGNGPGAGFCGMNCLEKVPDLDNDGDVDVNDLGMVTTDFGKTTDFDPAADVNGDGEIDIFDVVFVAGRFD